MSPEKRSKAKRGEFAIRHRDGTKTDSDLHYPILDNPEAEAMARSRYADLAKKLGMSRGFIERAGKMAAEAGPQAFKRGGSVGSKSLDRALRVVKKYSTGGEIEDELGDPLKAAYTDIGDYFGGVPSEYFSTTPEGKIRVAGAGKLLGLLGGRLKASESAMEAALERAKARKAREEERRRPPSALVKPGEKPNYAPLPPVSRMEDNEFHTINIEDALKSYWDSNPSMAPEARVPRLTPEELAEKQGVSPYFKSGPFEPGEISEPGTILPRSAGPSRIERAIKRHPEWGKLLDPSDPALYPPRSGIEELHQPAKVYRQSIAPSDAEPGGSREILESREFTPEYMLKLLERQRREDRQRKTAFIHTMKNKYPELGDAIKAHPEIADLLKQLEQEAWKKEVLQAQSKPKTRSKVRRKRTGEDDDEYARGGRLTKNIDRALRIAKKYASGGPLDESGLGDVDKHMPFTGGLLKSSIPGRTDKLPIAVKPGSYIVPADILSSTKLGEGNTIAGAKTLDAMLAKHRAKTQRRGLFTGLGRNARRSVKARLKGQKYAEGGEADRIPIIAAGGEYSIEPEVVESIGGGDMNKGHDILDDFVKRIRRHNIKTLKKLPGPKRN